MVDPKSPDPLRRTRRWAVVWTVMAVVSGLMATFLVARTLRQKSQEVKVETVSVVLAKADIPMGSTIGEEHLRIAEWPKDLVPAGSFRTSEGVKARVAKEDLVQDEPILERRLTSTELGSGMTALIPEDMRAMALKVDEVIGVAGFIRANDWVDVIAVMEPKTGNLKEVRSRLAIQHVKVLATGQEIAEPSKGSKPKTVAVVTLLVTPDQAEALALAMTEGQVRLALRGPIDEAFADTQGVEPADLVGPHAIAPAAIITASAHNVKRVARPLAKKPEVDSGPKPEVVEVFNGKKLEERRIRPASDIVVDRR